MAAADPDRLALWGRDGRLSYRQANEKIAAVVSALREKRAVPGEVVAAIGRNSLNMTILLWAAIRSGLVFMPLDYRLNRSDWKNRLNEADCRLLFADDDIDVDDTLIRFDRRIFSSAVITNAPAIAPLTLDLDRDAALVFTSGSGGWARGVVLSLANLYYSAGGTLSALPLEPGDSWAAVLPFFHVGGMMIPVRTALAGSSCYISSDFNPAEIIDLAAEKKITHISLVPAMLRMIIDQDKNKAMNRLKAIIVGGAGLDDDLRRSILDRKLPVYSSYGLTETASMVALSDLNDITSGGSLSGAVLPHREVLISDQGRILVRGPVVFSRYLDGEPPPTTPDGWLITEDCGYLDSRQRLVVTGRADRVIISGGENISLDEIEQALIGIEGVKAATVLEQNSRRWGQRPIAFVETTLGETSVKKLKTGLLAILPKYKIPERIIDIPVIPRTGIGKVDKARLREKYPEAFQADDD